MIRHTSSRRVWRHSLGLLLPQEEGSGDELYGVDCRVKRKILGKLKEGRRESDLR
jgi:hypothetical protein